MSRPNASDVTTVYLACADDLALADVKGLTQTSMVFLNCGEDVAHRATQVEAKKGALTDPSEPRHHRVDKPLAVRQRLTCVPIPGKPCCGVIDAFDRHSG